MLHMIPKQNQGYFSTGKRGGRWGLKVQIQLIMLLECYGLKKLQRAHQFFELFTLIRKHISSSKPLADFVISLWIGSCHYLSGKRLTLTILTVVSGQKSSGWGRTIFFVLLLATQFSERWSRLRGSGQARNMNMEMQSKAAEGLYSTVETSISPRSRIHQFSEQ